MKKLNLAIIGQGRSGKDIHGKYLSGSDNIYYDVKYVVDFDEFRRDLAKKTYPNCQTFADYKELFDKKDIDVVVNSTYSQMHYPITKDLLEHGFNVLVEKPFGRTEIECSELIKIAEDKGLTLAVFQQSFYAPFYPFIKEKIASGILGDVKQINVKYNGFARRWDWQTLQKNCAGGLYNTGPHPVGLALGFLDFDKNARVEFSRLSTALTSGDADDYAKVIISAPNKPVMDVEVTSCDAYCNYNVRVIGSRGNLTSNLLTYKMVYIVDGENPERPVIESSLKDENGNPIYCGEKLIKHEEEGDFGGTAFDVGTAKLYEQLYYKITENKPMDVTAEMARDVIRVIETVHAQNPLPLKY